jgi:hypothetical protein
VNAELLLAIRRADQAARDVALKRQAAATMGSTVSDLASNKDRSRDALLFTGVVYAIGITIIMIPIAMVWHLTRGK